MIKKIEATAEELKAFKTISNMECRGIGCTECPVRISYTGRCSNDNTKLNEVLVCPKSLADDILVNLENSD